MEVLAVVLGTLAIIGFALVTTLLETKNA